MNGSSYDYLKPLIDAHLQGRWGSPRRDVLQVHHYHALETLAREAGMACHKTRIKVPHAAKGIHREAVIPALVLERGGKAVVVDLHGNEGPRQIIKAFAKYYEVDVQWNREMLDTRSWKPAADTRYPAGSPSWGRRAQVLSRGRAMLHAIGLEQGTMTPGHGKPATPRL